MPYWERGEDIEKTEVLAAVAEEVGLDPRKLEEALLNNTYAEAVQESFEQANQLRHQRYPRIHHRAVPLHRGAPV